MSFISLVVFEILIDFRPNVFFLDNEGCVCVLCVCVCTVYVYVQCTYTYILHSTHTYTTGYMIVQASDCTSIACLCMINSWNLQILLPQVSLCGKQSILEIRKINHYSSFATTTVTPRQQLRHYSSDASTTVTPLQ